MARLLSERWKKNIYMRRRWRKEMRFVPKLEWTLSVDDSKPYGELTYDAPLNLVFERHVETHSVTKRLG